MVNSPTLILGVALKYKIYNGRLALLNGFLNMRELECPYYSPTERQGIEFLVNISPPESNSWMYYKRKLDIQALWGFV